MPTQNYEHVKMIMKSRSGYNEHNFCTVVSIATAFNWSAGKAHRLLAKHGRTHRRGPDWTMYTAALKEAANKANKCLTFTAKYDGMTIGRFCKENPTGTFIIAVKGHVIAVRDGEMLDWTGKTAGRRKIGYRASMTESGYSYGVAQIN